MEIRTLDSAFDKKVYNDRATHPMQLWEWGAAREQMGLKVVRFGEFDEDKLVNVFQMTLHAIPHTAHFIGYIPRSALPSSGVLEYMKIYGKENRVAFIKLEPNEKATSHKAIEPFIHSKLLTPSRYTLFPSWTITLDLKPTESDLLSKMKSKTRYNVRLAEKKGVTVKEVSTEQGFDTFIKLYFETTKRQKYFGHTVLYHRILFGALKKNYSSILIAYYENRPLAAYELFYHKDTLYYPYGGSSTQDQNVMAPNLLMWEAIKFGKKKGLKKFDMWGSLRPDYSHDDPWAGFTRFKEGYGGEFTQMVGTYDLVINPVIYHVFTVAQHLRSVFLGV